MKFIASFSGGKDSMLAIDRMINDNHECVGIMTTTNEDYGSWFHDIELSILAKIAESLNCPFYPAKLKQNQYSEMFEQVLEDIKKKVDYDAVVFGDIEINEHRKWCEERCDKVNLKAIFPLWQNSREKIVLEFIDKGYLALVKRIDKNKLDSNILARKLDNGLIKDFKQKDIDICGEEGEYHTLVYGGPLFNEMVDLKIGDIIETENSYVLQVKLNEK